MRTRVALVVGMVVLAGCQCSPATRCSSDAECAPGACLRGLCVVAEGGADAGDGGAIDAGARCPASCTLECCEDGTTPARAAQSCRAILAIADGGLASQPYWIDPDFEGPRPALELFCDMDAGWTLVGKVSGAFDNYDRWLTADIDVDRLLSPEIDAGFACVDAVWMAVNVATEVRLSNSNQTRWVEWKMTEGRTVQTWWRHDAGIANMLAAPDAGVVVYPAKGLPGLCYQNVYGINPGGAHGGGYPSTYALSPDGTIWGWNYPGEFCMSVTTVRPGSMGDDFIQNGNGQDAPSHDDDWPNSNYNAPPHVAVWLR